MSIQKSHMTQHKTLTIDTFQWHRNLRPNSLNTDRALKHALDHRCLTEATRMVSRLAACIRVI